MALADLSATAGDNPLRAPQVEEELKYRDEQLLRLKDQVLDLEELEDVSLGDFSLEDFRLELLDFLDQDAKRLRELPLGTYAVVAATEKHPPGAVFCLRAKQPDPALKPSNLNPDGALLSALRRARSGGRVARATRRCGWDLPRRAACCCCCANCAKGQVAPDDALCQAFAAATQSGQDMSLVNDLVGLCGAGVRRGVAAEIAGQPDAARRAIVGGRRARADGRV